MNILEVMKQQRLYFDGGMGSLLQARGLKPGELPETWNIKHPEVLIEIHKEYLKAGANIINSNTFGANSLKFNKETGYTVDEIVTAAMKNAKQAITEIKQIELSELTEEKTNNRFIALDMGPTGKLLKPLGDLPFETAYELYKEVVLVGAREGADLVLIETMSDSYETKAAILAAKENCDLPIFVTMIFDEKGKLLTGGNVASTVALLEGLGVDALGINCGLGPVQMKSILEEILKVSSIPIIVNPNAGLPRSENGKTVYDINADEFAKYMKEIVEMGVSIVGGCCGTTPEHIEKTVDLTKHIPLPQINKKNRTVISSYSQAVVFEKDPIIIGERINPTGKSKFKQALRDHNLEYILKEAITQQDNGAHVLDVNVGLPEINEVSLLTEAVQEIQSICDLPLQLDTSNIEAMEQAMRIYNGKPLINSVNGKEETMNAIFPLVKKYGGVVVALVLDENGIPETADGRIEIAKKIYKKASEYEIQAKDIIIDGLCMTVSSDSKGALTTLETIKRVKEELNGKTILGVSNISFGLPKREYINSAFFTMALQNGLNAAIINPNSEAMMKSYYCYRALADLDNNCMDYINQYGVEQSNKNQSSQDAPIRINNGTEITMKSSTSLEKDLEEAIKKGLKEASAQVVFDLLKEKNALDIINECMIPALNIVGKGFEEGTVFLPQLLMSAEATKAAFEVIKEQLSQSGEVQKKKGKIILATVKGDIHDIGKNIVKVLLENYSYEVIDLGKDVPPEVIVETTIKEQVSLVGLSALMTTTVPSMEETISLLREQAPNVKVMVGGAVLTREYADQIGADIYCKDAMASVKYAEKIMCKKLF